MTQDLLVTVGRTGPKVEIIVRKGDEILVLPFSPEEALLLAGELCSLARMVYLPPDEP